MKKITIPPPVQISVFNEKTKTEELKDFPFADFLINNALVHRAFGSTIDLLEQSQKVTDQLTSANVGDVIELEDKTWLLIDTVVNQPEAPYDDVKLARKLLPFMRAIRNAQ